MCAWTTRNNSLWQCALQGLPATALVLLACTALSFQQGTAPQHTWLQILCVAALGLLSKGYACALLPWRIRLLIAEACTLAHCYTACRGFPPGPGLWVTVVLQHAVGVLLPLACFRPRPISTARSATTPNNGCQKSLAQVASCDSEGQRQLGALSKGAISASQQTKVTNNCVLLPYNSVLGERLKIDIKINTQHHPEHLPKNALDKLARLVEGFDMCDGRPLASMTLGAHVRRGCVLIALEVCSLPGSVSGSRASACQTLAYAKHVLPSVLAELGLDAGLPGCSTAGSGCGTAKPQLQPGQYLQLQLGGHTVRASADAHTQQWVFELQAGSSHPAATAAATLSGLDLFLAQPDMLRLAAAGPAEPAVHAVPFTVQLRRVDALAGQALLGSDPGCMADDSASSSLQLWVLCQGQYVRTVVHETDLYLGTVRATAYVPAAALARHHQPDGPAARLQLLTVELGHGSATLSRTRLLVDAAQHMQPAVQASSFGWWGASAEQAAGLVADVCRLTAATAQDSSDIAVSSHQAFVSDLAVWLDAVQQAAPASCCEMCQPCSCPLTLALTTEQHAALATSVQTHAAQSGLASAVTFLQRTQDATGLGGAKCGLAATAAACSRLARQQLAGHGPCKQCDALFYETLRRSLPVRPAWVGLQRLLGCYYGIAEPSLQSLLVLCVMGAISVVHTRFTLWAVPAVRGMGSKHEPVVEFLFSYHAYVWGKLGLLASLVRFRPAFIGTTLVEHMYMLPIGYVLATYSHQVPLWGRVSTLWMRVLVFLDACILAKLMVHCFDSVPGWYGTAGWVASVLVPLAMHAIWRRWYSSRCCAAPGTVQEACTEPLRPSPPQPAHMAAPTFASLITRRTVHIVRSSTAFRE